MHGATGHHDRCPRRDLELVTRAVKAKPAFQHFKDLLPLFVKMEGRPDERRDAGFDDRKAPPTSRLCTRTAICSPGMVSNHFEGLAPADNGNLLSWMQCSSFHLLDEGAPVIVDAQRTRDAGSVVPGP